MKKRNTTMPKAAAKSARKAGPKLALVPKSRIEKGVPIPQRRGGAGLFKYPELLEMGIGDSIRVNEKSQAAASARAAVAGKKNGWKYTVRTEGDGQRIWRIA